MNHKELTRRVEKSTVVNSPPKCRQKPKRSLPETFNSAASRKNEAIPPRSPSCEKQKLQKPKEQKGRELRNEEDALKMTKLPSCRQNAAKKSMPVPMTSYQSKPLAKSGTNPVYIIVYIARTRYRLLTGVRVKPSDWDKDKLVVKKSNPDSANLNLIIRNAHAKLNDIMVKHQLDGTRLTGEILKEEFDRPEYVFNFNEFITSAINARKGEITDSTMRCHKGVASKLKEFKDPIFSDMLTMDFLQSYQKYLKGTLKNNQNTRHNNFKTLNTYINIAVKKKLLKVNPLEKNPNKKGSPDRIYLDEDELQILIDLYRSGKLSIERQNVLRQFLFGCFTGLRISDLRRVTMDNLVGNILVLIPYKTKNVTGKTVKVPIKDFAKQLIADESPFRIDGKIFNCISEQNMRERLKMVVKGAGINKVISFHAARHTYATIYLRNTNDLPGLQKLLGHANIRETMVYAHVMIEDIEKSLDFQNKF